MQDFKLSTRPTPLEVRSKSVKFLGQANHQDGSAVPLQLFYQENTMSVVIEEEDTPAGSESSRAEGLATATKKRKAQAQNPQQQPHTAVARPGEELPLDADLKYRQSSQQHMTKPLTAWKVGSPPGVAESAGLRSRKVKGASSTFSQEEMKPDSLFVQGIEAIIELKGALNTLQYGDGDSALPVEKQAEARRIQRALRQAVHTAFFNQMAIAKKQAVDNNLKDGIDLQKGILKRSHGLHVKDKTAANLGLNAPVVSESPINHHFNLKDFIHMKDEQSIETSPDRTLDDLRQHIPEKRIREFIEKVYIIQSQKEGEVCKLDSTNVHVKQNEEKIGAMLSGALPATKDLICKMIDHLEEYLETLSHQDPKRYADLAYLGKSEANSLNTLQALLHNTFIDESAKYNRAIRKRKTQEDLEREIRMAEKQAVASNVDDDSLEDDEDLSKLTLEERAERMNERRKMKDPKAQINKLLNKLGVTPVLRKLDQRNKFIDELLQDLSQNQQRQVGELKRQLYDATIQKFQNDTKQKKEEMGKDNKQFIKKIQHEYVDGIKQINSLAMHNVNEANVAAKKLDVQAKMKLRDALKLQVKQGSLTANQRRNTIRKIDQELDQKHLQMKIISKLKQKYNKMSDFEQFLEENFELDIQRSLPTSLTQRDNQTLTTMKDTMSSLVDHTRPLISHHGKQKGSNAAKFHKERNPNEEYAYISKREQQFGYTQRELAEKIKHQFDLKDRRSSHQKNSVKLALPHTARVIPRKNFLKAREEELNGDEMPFQEVQHSLRNMEENSIYNLGISKDMQVMLEKNQLVKERSKSKLGVPPQVLWRNSVQLSQGNKADANRSLLYAPRQSSYKLIGPGQRVSSRQELIIQQNMKKTLSLAISSGSITERKSGAPQGSSYHLLRHNSLKQTVMRHKDTQPAQTRRHTILRAEQKELSPVPRHTRERFKSEKQLPSAQEVKPMQRRATLVQRVGESSGVKAQYFAKYKDVARILHEKDEEEDEDSSTSQDEEFSESSYALSLIQEQEEDSRNPNLGSKKSQLHQDNMMKAQKRLQYQMLQAEQRIQHQKLLTRKDAVEVFLERKQEILQKDMVHHVGKTDLSNKECKNLDDPVQEVNTLNNQKKFVNFLIDTHYHEKNQQMRTEIDTRRLCLKNKYIGPKQLKALLRILSRNAQMHQNRIAYIDLSNNEIGDEGVMLIARWIKAEQEPNKRRGQQHSSSESSESEDFTLSEADTAKTLGVRDSIDYKDVQKLNVSYEGANLEENLHNAESGSKAESPRPRTSLRQSPEVKTMMADSEQIGNAVYKSQSSMSQQETTQTSAAETETHSDGKAPRASTKAAEQLVSLKLSQVSASSKAFLVLLKVLRHNKTLIELDISNKDGFLRNSNMSMKLLSNGICPYLNQTNCILNHLNIYGCNIGNEGFLKLSEAVVQNHSLVILNIGSNSISGMQSANAIIRILKECFNILDLNISSNNMGNLSMSRIFTHLFIEGASICNLDVSNCGITQIQCGADIGRFRMGLPLQSFNFSGNILKQTLNTIMQDLQQSRAAGESMGQSKKKQSRTARGYQGPQKVPDPPARTSSRARYAIDQSIARLQALVIERENLQELNLSKCLLGDSAFRAVMHGVHRVENSERLSLNFSKNKLTNQSISYITEVFLNFKPDSADEVKGKAKEQNRFEVNDKTKLRLKGLNLSGNFLRSRSTINFDEIREITHHGFEKECVHNEGPNAFQTHFDPKLLECEMKRFFSLINYQIFIENLDLSYNKELGEDLAHFIYKYLSQYEVMKDPQFNFTKIKAQKAPSSPARSSRARSSCSSPSKTKDNGESTFRKMKYHKNVLLLNLNLHKCCIGQHQVDLINNILDSNKKFRRQQLKRLQETEHFVLTNSNILNQNLAFMQGSANNNLMHVKKEHEELQKYYKDKMDVHHDAQEIVKHERDAVHRQLNVVGRELDSERVRERRIAQAYEEEKEKLEVEEHLDMKECQELDVVIKKMEAEIEAVWQTQNEERMVLERRLRNAREDTASEASRLRGVERGITAIVSPQPNQRVQHKQKETKPNTKKRPTSKRPTHVGAIKKLGGGRSTSLSALASTKKSLGGSKSMSTSNMNTQRNSKQNSPPRPAILGLERKQGAPAESIFGQPDEKRQRAKSAGIRGRSSNAGKISRPQSQHQRRKSAARTKLPPVTQESTLSFLKEDHDTAKQSEDQLPVILQSTSDYARIPIKLGQKSRPKTSKGNFGVLEQIRERKETAPGGLGAASSRDWPREQF